jgi:hypothetical protein
MRSVWLVCVAAVVAGGCGSRQDIRDFSTILVGLPDGKTIKAEPLATPVDMARGAMFRDSMPQDRGLLYQHRTPGKYSYWMYQTNVALDTIWMDERRRVVEIVPNMPPCPAKSAKECPHFGGREDSKFELQLAAGQAARHGVRVGSVLSF